VPVLTQSFADAVAEAEAIITGAPHVTSEVDLAEGYDYLAGHIKASLQLAWAYQRDFPYLVTSAGPYTKMGLDNPDTLYFTPTCATTGSTWSPGAAAPPPT
jgi:hypothetical protein